MLKILVSVSCANYTELGNMQKAGEFMRELRVDSATPMFVGKNDVFHFLQVTVSFNIYPELYSSSNEATFLLSAERIDDKNLPKKCFLLDLTKTNLTKLQSGRRRFFTTLHPNDFEFGGVYNFTVVPTPDSDETKEYFTVKYKMPRDPDEFQDDSQCNNFSVPNGNMQASKWYASFLTITKQEVERSLHVSFIGAPPGFCFEEYTLSLNKASLEHQAVISVKDMKPKVIHNKTYLIGEYTFTGLQYGVPYQPVVSAGQESKRRVNINGKMQRKCLCRVTRLIDGQVGGCSCILSEYQVVFLEKLQRPSFLPISERPNRTFISVLPRKENTTMLYIALFGAAVIAAILLGLIYFMFVRFYQQYNQRKVIIHFGRPPEDSNDKETTVPDNTPLIQRDRTNVLILYSHDTQPHDDAVMALASLLHETLGFNVHVDNWDSDTIETNMMDYVAYSVQKADRIIIVNSVGAFKRYEGKIEHEYRIERINRGPFDELFAMQIDQALGRQSCILSVRFPYTPAAFILPPLSVALQFVIPDNLNPLQIALCKVSTGPVPIEATEEPMIKMKKAIARMLSYVTAEPNWFKVTHRLVPVQAYQNPALIQSGLRKHSANIALHSKYEDSVSRAVSERKNSEETTDTRKSSSAIETASEGIIEIDSAVVDGKLDSGIHTEEEYYNSEILPSVKNSDVYMSDKKADSAVKKVDDGLVIEKTDSGYIGEVRSVNIYS